MKGKIQDFPVIQEPPSNIEQINEYTVSVKQYNRQDFPQYFFTIATIEAMVLVQGLLGAMAPCQLF